MASVFAIVLSALFFISLPVSAAGVSPIKADSHVQVVSEGVEAVSLGFDLSDFESQVMDQEGESCEFLFFPGEGLTYEYGKPILPAISRFVVVPPRAGLELDVEASEPRTIRLNNPPLLCADEEITQTVNLDMSGDSNLFPRQFAEMSEPTVIRGVRLVKVTTYPLQYDSSTNTYLYREHINAEVRFTNDEPVNPATHPIRRNRSQNFLKYIASLAINGDNIGRDDPEQEPEHNGHYLIATHQSCLEFAAPFIEWRRKAGYKVDILRLSAGDALNTASVKRGIQDIYDDYLDEGEDPFEYLLLIGDRSHYYWGPAPGWQLAAETGEGSGTPHADYKYACLEGNDNHPDVALSRWPSGSRDMMELAVGRTLLYEMEPDMEDDSWFTRGLVYSQHWGNNAQSAWDITIHTNVRWGEEVLQYLGYDDITFYEDYDWDRDANRIGPVIVRAMNEGTNVLIGRAENYHFVRQGAGDFERDIDENTVFSINITASGHGEWASEMMFRSGAGNRLKGYVATTMGWSTPPTTAMSACWLEMTRGVMLNDLPFGWGFSMGVTALELSLANYQWSGRQVYLVAKSEFNIFGDPGLQPWVGVPRIVAADFPEWITESTRLIEVYVFDPETEDSIPGAQVTLYSPGNMPDFDDADYADYDDMVTLTVKTDIDGMARFVIDEDIEFNHASPLYVTVTGRDIRPFMEEIAVEQSGMAIELSSFLFVEEDGNEDEEINPGEVFSLSLTAVNLHDEDEVVDVTAVVSSLSPWVTVEENEVAFGDIEAEGEEDGEEGVIIHISPSCPDGSSRPITRPIIKVDFFSGEQSWSSVIKLDPVAPNLEVNRIIGGNVIPTDVDEYELDVELSNIGGLAATDVTTVLHVLGIEATVLREFADYPDMDPGEEGRIDGNPYSVGGNRIIVPGTMASMMIVVQANVGFVDTAFFDIQISQPGDDGPVGPDDYGYICFDDTDQDWDIAPEYEWLEISLEERDRDFNGEECDFDGRAPHDIGESQVVDLGFTTQFYGHEYTQITICTNGFISMGDQGRVTNLQNWPMDRAMGGGLGMIAPLWDWLRFTDDSQVYYFYDMDENRFIVEWYKLRHKNGGNSDLTFQVIIYDMDVWVTETGDPNILIQYKTVSNVAGENIQDKRIPYASVGISSPTGTTGLNYSFGNEYPDQAAPLAARRALLFATSPKYRSGILYGWILDYETEEPIVDAIVSTEHGLAARTDEEGYYRIPNALAEIEFDITARKPGYNDSTLTIPDTLLLENDSLEVSFNLLHPEFVPSVWSLRADLDPDLATDLEFSLTNEGNGPLDWTLLRRLPDNADFDPWEHRLAYHSGDSLNDDRLMGVVYVDDHFYVSGANKMGQEDGDNLIYKLTREGALVDTFVQAGGLSRYGMSDLAWDEDSLLWGPDGQNVIGFTLDGDSVTSFEGEYNPNTAVTWDSDLGVLWVCGRSTARIYAYDTEGNEIRNVQNRGFSIYGLAYWPEDPDGYKLYILHKVGAEQQTVHKMNTLTGDTMQVAILVPQEGGKPQGAFITNKFDVYSWVFVCVTGASNDQGGDRVDVWQLDARRDWFQPYFAGEEREPAVDGRIETDETMDFILHLTSEGLPPVPYRGFLEFHHNAVGTPNRIDVLLNIIGPLPPEPFSLLEPANGDTLDTTLVTFKWEESIDLNRNEIVSYSILLQDQEGFVLSFEDIDTTLFEIDLDSTLFFANLAEGQEISLTWRVQASSGQDNVDSEQPFTFSYTKPLTEGILNIGVPVEFGLQSIYPSPFNSVTSIRFGADRPEHTKLTVFDVTGRQAAILYDRQPTVGYHQVIWDASHMASGVYLIWLESAGRVNISKVALIK